MTQMTDADPLRLEAIYYSAPIPRDLAVLTILGAVFDKVYFPGVYLPKTGFDQEEVNREIIRLENLNTPDRGDRDLLIGILKFVRYAAIVDGFCEFTAPKDDVFGSTKDVKPGMVEEIYYALHGPPKPNWQPMFDTGHNKALPGGDEFIAYPGTYHYFANALIHSSKTGITIVNDLPGLPIPGFDEDAVPVDNAKILSALLAIECMKVILPSMPLLRPEDLMEFRAENTAMLRAFRRSMLRYSADLNEKIAGLSPQEFVNKTKFFVDTEIVPALDELRNAMSSKRAWSKRAFEGVRIIPEIAAAYFTMGRDAAIAKILTAYAGQFFKDLADKGDQRATVKRSGLYYLLRLQTHATDLRRRDDRRK